MRRQPRRPAPVAVRPARGGSGGEAERCAGGVFRLWPGWGFVMVPANASTSCLGGRVVWPLGTHQTCQPSPRLSGADLRESTTRLHPSVCLYRQSPHGLVSRVRFCPCCSASESPTPSFQERRWSLTHQGDGPPFPEVEVRGKPCTQTQTFGHSTFAWSRRSEQTERTRSCPSRRQEQSGSCDTGSPPVHLP